MRHFDKMPLQNVKAKWIFTLGYENAAAVCLAEDSNCYPQSWRSSERSWIASKTCS